LTLRQFFLNAVFLERWKNSLTNFYQGLFFLFFLDCISHALVIKEMQNIRQANSLASAPVGKTFGQTMNVNQPLRLMSVIRSQDMPHPVDVHVGTKIRLTRASRGISQQQLSEMLHISFQQLQK
jgi:DNA-binding transcriptional regulator YiaG